MPIKISISIPTFTKEVYEIEAMSYVALKIFRLIVNLFYKKSVIHFFHEHKTKKEKLSPLKELNLRASLQSSTTEFQGSFLLWVKQSHQVWAVIMKSI